MRSTGTAKRHARRTSAVGALAFAGGLAVVCAGAAGAQPPSSSAASPHASTEDAWGPVESLEDRLLLTSEPSHARIAERPTNGATVACAPRRTVCVHAGAGVDRASVERALAATDEARSALSALGLVQPLVDGGRGGGPELDVYLDESLDRAAAHADVGLWATSWDRATAFVRAPPPRATGCADTLGLTRAVIEAGLLGVDAATEPRVLDAWSTHLALILATCPELALELVDEAQRAPDRSLFESPAAFLYPRHLEERWGNGRPGELAVSLVAISAQRTPATRRPVDEPDAFDALRVSLRGQGSSMPATVLDLAVARAFMGSRSDDAHLVDVTRYGDLGRPRHEWAIEYASLPRRLLPARPVAALGATYVWIDLGSAPLDAELTIVAEWEAPVAFRWALVEVDGGGAARARTDVVPVFGETRIEKTLRGLGGAGGLLVVGVNDGEARRDAPVDPSRDPGEPRGYQLTIYE